MHDVDHGDDGCRAGVKGVALVLVLHLDGA